MKGSKTVALTGAGGLLGSHIFIELLRCGYHVRLLLRNPENTLNELQTLFGLCRIAWPPAEDYSVFTGDILELDTLEPFVKGADIVIHSAAIVDAVGIDRNKLLKINAEGTANLVNTAMANGNIRFIHISSIATLGPKPDGLCDEDYFFKASPHTSDYAISKYSAEQEVWRSIEEGLNAAILNPSFIVGPSVSGRSGSAVFSNLIKGLPGYVEGLTGYVDVRDAAKATVMLAVSELRGVRLICSAENLHVSEFIRLSADALSVRKPNRQIGSFWFRPLVWLEKLRAVFSGQKPRFNMQTLRMASGRQAYDGTRLCQKLNGFSYSPVSKAVEYSCAVMKEIAKKESFG